MYKTPFRLWRRSDTKKRGKCTIRYRRRRLKNEENSCVSHVTTASSSSRANERTMLVVIFFFERRWRRTSHIWSGSHTHVCRMIHCLWRFNLRSLSDGLREGQTNELVFYADWISNRFQINQLQRSSGPTRRRRGISRHWLSALTSIECRVRDCVKSRAPFSRDLCSPSSNVCSSLFISLARRRQIQTFSRSFFFASSSFALAVPFDQSLLFSSRWSKV